MNLQSIYARTDGFCHICHRKVHFKNYGKVGRRGAWEIEHSVARALGGTDHGNNLRPACVPCNRSKGTTRTRTVRKRFGNTRAPLSTARKEVSRRENAAICGAVGALLGIAGGVPGMLILGAVGAALGRNIEPPK